MPSEKELPDELRKLARRQALKLSSDRWDYDIGRLIETLEKVVGAAPNDKITTSAVKVVSAAESGDSRPVPFINSKMLYSLAILVVIVASVIYYRIDHSRIVTPITPAPVDNVLSQAKPERVTPHRPTQILEPVKKTPVVKIPDVPIVPIHKTPEVPIRAASSG